MPLTLTHSLIHSLADSPSRLLLISCFFISPPPHPSLPLSPFALLLSFDPRVVSSSFSSTSSPHSHTLLVLLPSFFLHLCTGCPSTDSGCERERVSERQALSMGRQEGKSGQLDEAAAAGQRGSIGINERERIPKAKDALSCSAAAAGVRRFRH